MKVQIPEIYVALVLQDPQGQPAQDEYETLRLATGGSILQKFKAVYPGVNGFDFKFVATEYGSDQPEPRFQVFLEVAAAVSFSLAKPPATPQDLLEQSLQTFGRNYLLDVVRPLGGAFASAVEVQAKRLKRPTEGGAVKAPACYAAFVCSSPPTEP